MAKTSTWIKHLKHEGNSVISHLFELEEGKDNDVHIHQIRVHIKKMNAILHLQGSEQLSSIILRRGFKKVFSFCGEIRNCQIMLDILKIHAFSNQKLDLELRQKILRRTKMLVKLKPALINMLEYSLKLGLSEVKDFSDKLILSNYQITVAELFLLFTELKTDKDLHSARKLIKNLVYPAALIGTKNKKTYQLLIESLAVLQDRIGKWHDLYITLEHIKKSRIPKTKGIVLLETNEKKSRKEVLTEIRKMTISFSALQ